jgi:hypothetical protein
MIHRRWPGNRERVVDADDVLAPLLIRSIGNGQEKS